MYNETCIPALYLLSLPTLLRCLMPFSPRVDTYLPNADFVLSPSTAPARAHSCVAFWRTVVSVPCALLNVGHGLVGSGTVQYGVYTTILRKVAPSDDAVAMPLVLGYMGAGNTLLFL